MGLADCCEANFWEGDTEKAKSTLNFKEDLQL